MASLDESVRFVGESHPDKDPSEATSKRAGSQSTGPSSGWRRSLRRMVAYFHFLIDEEEEEVGGNEGEASSPGEERRVVTDLVAVQPSSMSPQVIPYHPVEEGVLYPEVDDYLCSRS
ncbi:UNVERIFIED_CONTAM: hypothetical protein Slati_3472100 [Sesamum latifolium]|uniref:Uncharacterized protein n=1 Tax=Sesamum latifolium TaxID=2727402 RepID=A0AAW2UJ86_9LAMI